MNILVVAHLFPSVEAPTRGVFVLEQVEALRRAGHRVEVVSGDFDGRDSRDQYRGIDVERVGLPWLDWLPSRVALLVAAWSYRARITRILRARRGSVDIVHAHFGFPDGWAAALAGRAVSLPVVVTLHGSDVTRQLQRGVQRRLIATGLKRAGKLVTVSQALEEAVRSLVPDLASRIVTVPNGYNPGHLHLVEQRRPEYFLFVGSLLDVKNPTLLVRAYAKIAEATDLDLVLVGDGPLRQEVHSLVHELGLQDRVSITGFLPHEDVQSRFERAAALVLPSSREGMPVVVLEALATGTPVVASDVGGIPELVKGDQQGRLVPAGDLAALADAMLWAAENEWDARRVRDSADIRTWDENSALLVEELQRVLASGGEAS